MFTNEHRICTVQIHVFHKISKLIRMKLSGRVIHDPRKITCETQLNRSNRLEDITEKVQITFVFDVKIR